MSSYQTPNNANRIDLSIHPDTAGAAQASSNRLRCSEQDRKNLESAASGGPDLVCLSHLRWDFVYQRPQHLLGRCAQARRTFFFEEPIIEFTDSWWIDVSQRECGVWVVVPHIPEFVNEELAAAMQRSLINELFDCCGIANPILWYYTPMALAFSDHLQPCATVYDCMDELSAFQGAPPALRALEKALLNRANVVFTGGQSLYEAKQHQHDNIHAFPSSIEVAHFAQARMQLDDPADQAAIPHPRLGFYGVIDERMDLELIDGIAQARPDWHLVIVGPTAKIDPEQLPRHANIHYLGGKTYQELPHYLAGWDVAILPFACNESTRFISPTKTPEYLAAGKPVVSTSIRDVVRPYGQQNLVHIADTVEEFVAAAEQALDQARQDSSWLQQVDTFLANTSWDKTWAQMNGLIEAAIAQAMALQAVPNSRQSVAANASQSSNSSKAPRKGYAAPVANLTKSNVG
ncbi:MAG: glycosyltransferase family 1 protein [Cyanobacteria bacterium Co-bin8]|nr:glycosyltransferase family 1 protein [Cyanobacteria bacterium Co-bin8]